MGHQKNALERELWEGERIDLQKKIKLLNRKIEELTDQIKMLEEQNMELKSENNRRTLELEEMRSAFRSNFTMRPRWIPPLIAIRISRCCNQSVSEFSKRKEVVGTLYL